MAVQGGQNEGIVEAGTATETAAQLTDMDPGKLSDGPTELSSAQLDTVRSRLYQRRFLQPNSHFSAFFKIYKICTLLHRSELKIMKKPIQKFEFERCRSVQIL